MRRGAIALAGACIALAGCASTPTSRPAPRVDLSGDCATTLAQLPRHPVGLREGNSRGQPRQFADLAHCLADDAGRRPVARFDLGATAPPYAVTIDLDAGRGGALAARVSVLDDQGRMLQTHGFDDFIARGDTYTLTFFVNPGDARARELVIEPDLRHVGRAIARFTGQTQVVPIITTVVVGSIVTGTERRSEVALRDAGTVAVTVKPFVTQTLETPAR